MVAKRIFDLILVISGICLLIPLFLIIAIWIISDSKGPVFYRQIRVGLNGEYFKIHKFRTMYINSDKLGELTVGEDRRVTNSGRILRRYKLDELAQLFDVLLGKMSLVGPRPEVPKYIQCYPQDIRDKILSVKPGITDLASIEMIDENELLKNYEDPEKAYIEKIMPVKQKYYLRYVEQHSVINDFVIILKTIVSIFAKR